MTLKLDTVAKIRNAIIDGNTLRERIKIGVEIETQFDDDSREFDESSARDCAESSIDTYDVCARAGVSHDEDWIRALGCKHDPVELANKLDLDWDDMVEDIVDSYRDDDESDFWSTSGDASDIGDDICRKTDWEHDDDASVSGREFRFENPVTGTAVAESMVETLFERIDESSLYIDSDCSCHIHLQLPDMFHTGCNLLQQLIFEELFNQVEQFPETVKKRLRACPRWIQPTADGHNTCKSKYNPVQCHGLGTWEFRLWGRVQNAEEFRVCLELSIVALERAYDRYIQNPSLPALHPEVWRRAATVAMCECEPIEIRLANATPDLTVPNAAPAEPTADIGLSLQEAMSLLF